MVAHCCQSINQSNQLSWPMSAKSDIFFIQKEKKQNYHGPQVPNLILSYQALYITK